MYVYDINIYINNIYDHIYDYITHTYMGEREKDNGFFSYKEKQNYSFLECNWRLSN